MSKEEYAQFHFLLAKLKYELTGILLCTELDSEYNKQVQKQIEAIDTLLPIIIKGE